MLVVAALFYTLLLVYGTLFPLSGWQWPSGSILNPLFPTWPQKLHTSDVITNLLVYMPLGFLVALIFRRRYPMWSLLILATAVGTLLSFSLEYLQTYLPSRVTSLADILLNSLGSFLGVTLVLLVNQSSPLHRRLFAFKQYWFKDDPLAHTGLAVLGLWALSQLFPLVPSLDFGSLRNGLRPLWHTLNNPLLYDPWQATIYALNITGLGMLASTVIREHRRALPLFALFVITVLLLKVPVVGRQLSAESITGLIIGLTTILILSCGKASFRGIAAVVICSAFLLEALSSGISNTTKPMNWVPFLGHMQNVMDMTDVITTAWPFAALAYLALSFTPPQPKQVAISGAILVFISTLAVEWLQQSLPGRYPDITDVVLATLGWSLPWLYMSAIQKSAAPQNAN